jgi:sugar O-acyltransferase (sialic acid O-acetyltransferase NeuD family)
MKKGIIGAGGFAREVYWSLDPSQRVNCVFFVNDEFWENNDDKIYPLSKFDANEYEVVVAVGNPTDRYNIVKKLPKNTKYFTHIHPTCQILGEDVEIGEGSIICSGTIITTNVKLGKHTHLNLHTTIGHDCVIGDFFTTSPGAKISGNCVIGDVVYIGTNASVKEKIKINSLVTIGLNAGVVNNITEPGVYVGVPAKKIK